MCYKCDSITLEACATSLNETDWELVNCNSVDCTMAIGRYKFWTNKVR